MTFPQRNGSSSLVALADDLAGEAGRTGSSPAVFDVARIQPTRIVFNRYGPSGNRRVHWEVFPAFYIPIIDQT